MKITELKCTACNGDMEIDPNDPNVAVCRYCKTRYVIEYEDNEQIHMKGSASESWYTPRQPVTKKIKKTGWEPYGWKRGVALAIFGVVAVVGLNWKGLAARMEQDSKQKAVPVIGSEAVETAGTEKAVAEPFNGMLEEFVETLYGKPQEQITQEELDAVKWLEISMNQEGGKVRYSMDSPYENQDAVLSEIAVSERSLTTQQVCRFTGLEKLLIPSALSPKFKNLKLKGISCREESLTALKENLANPEQLEELEIWSDIESLDSLGAFPALRSFSLKTDETVDLAPLAQLKNLTSLSLDGDGITDYSVLSTMSGLTSLSITSEGLKDIGFVSSMAQLGHFEVRDASLIQMNGLGSLTALESLVIDNCEDTQDISGVEGLASLKSLWLEIPYGCAEPELSGLGNLNSLYIENMDNLNFLSAMPQLQSLTLKACEIKNPEVFSGLSQLKELECSYLSGELGGWLFATRLPALESLDLTAVTTYEDMSALFGIQTLHTLILNGVECELRFDKLKPNENLKTLEMRGVKLYTNIDIQGGGGIYSIDYDNVNLDEHTDFLVNYPGLETLNLSENKLTQLNAAATLKNLTQVDISDNFITDLKPFTALSGLKLIKTAGNPIENYLLLPEDVTVIK